MCPSVGRINIDCPAEQSLCRRVGGSNNGGLWSNFSSAIVSSSHQLSFFSQNRRHEAQSPGDSRAIRRRKNRERGGDVVGGIGVCWICANIMMRYRCGSVCRYIGGKKKDGTG